MSETGPCTGRLASGTGPRWRAEELSRGSRCKKCTNGRGFPGSSGKSDPAVAGDSEVVMACQQPTRETRDLIPLEVALARLEARLAAARAGSKPGDSGRVA